MNDLGLSAMRVNYQHVIQETPSQLKKLQTQQKELSKFRKMQGLYLLKTGEVKTVTHLADYLGVHRVTIQQWLKIYRQQGVSRLISEPEDQRGRPKQLEDSAMRPLGAVFFQKTSRIYNKGYHKKNKDLEATEKSKNGWKIITRFSSTIKRYTIW